jgi:hypothetical protein
MTITQEDYRKKVPYEDEREETIHYKSIEIVSVRIGESFECVKRVYEIVLSRLKKNARVKDYLPILAAKRTQELIDKRRSLRKSDS